MKILVVGTSGMLGYSLFSNLAECNRFDVFGTVRTSSVDGSYFGKLKHKLFFNTDINEIATLQKVITKLKPNVVINCIGLIKQNDASKQHSEAIYINSLFPHKLAEICNTIEAKLIHFSTDCVFSVKRGYYSLDDLPDATDLYGRSKCLGEVDYGPHLTFRTSIIGHELSSKRSLIDWFLSQKNSINGYSNAIFSGLPTCVIARFLTDNILLDDKITGLHHLSVKPIDKYNLLKLVAKIYGKKIEIIESPDFVIDRSLNSKPLQIHTGFLIPSWESLVSEMYDDYIKRYENKR